MNFENLTDKERSDLANAAFRVLGSAQELRDWVELFLELRIPLEITDPDSNSSPLDAIWQVYNTFKHNTGDVNPGYILMSSREGMKCSKKGTITITYDGFKKIEDVKVGDTIWTGFSWQKVTQTYDEGFKPGLTVRLEGGSQSTGTPIHRYWCLRNGVEQWIAGKDLNPETDLICLNTDTGLKDKADINKEKYDIGYFLGLLIGDGGCSLIDKYGRFSITTIDQHVKDFIYYFADHHLYGSHICYGETNLSYTIANKKAIEQIKKWGITNTYSWEKTIPSYAWQHVDAMKGFIAGVFDTDGCWDKKGDSFFEMTAGKLLDEMQIALTAFGIESKVRHNKKLYGLQKHLTSRLTIGQTESAKFEKLGIQFKAKKAQKYSAPKIPNCKDTLPVDQVKELIALANNKTDRSIRNRKNKKPTIRPLDYPTVTYDNLNKLIAWLKESEEHGLLSNDEIAIYKRYEKTFSNKWKKFTVEDVGQQYFYDLTVENEHSYWSNGLISHNTVSVAILETLLLLHFELDIGHAAATEEQSAVALGYISGFLLKVEPLMAVRGWTNLTQNKRLFKFKAPSKKQPFIKVVICSTKGMNSLHSNVLFLDELDLADPKALKEGKNIVGYSKGIYGVTVYLSTRKYAFGNMSQAIEQAPEINYKIVNWNVLDVTEACPPTRHKPEGPKQNMYVNKNLPLRQLVPDQFELLPEVEKAKWDLVPNVHQGCVGCKLLPVCKTRLASKPQTATGGFYKPIGSVIQKFTENDPDTAEAQLMCFSEETQILMGDGTSKNIKDVSVGDEVISHTGTKRKVTELFSRKYSGPAFEINHSNWKHFGTHVVTPEHPYFINGSEFLSIDKLNSFEFDKWGGIKSTGDYLSLPANYIPSDKTEINYEDFVKLPVKEDKERVKLAYSRTGRTVPSKYTLDANLGWILGYFLAEGFYIKNGMSSDAEKFVGITFCSDEREIEYHEKVRTFAQSIGLTTSEFKNKQGHGYTQDIHNSTLATFFFELCGQYSDKKTIHPTLMDANIEFLEGILKGFDAGDGTKRKSSYKELTTTSYDLASQLFTIAARLGLCPRVTKKPEAVGRKQAYLVHFIDTEYIHTQKRTKFKLENGYNQYRLDTKKSIEYSGTVYNIEVEEDHSYIADGVAVHNCWRPGSTGLIYPRFNPTVAVGPLAGTGNVITMTEAYESIFGPTNQTVTELTLLYEMKKAGIPFYAGVDWGYTHDFVIAIVAQLPNGDVWLMETFASPGLEFSDQLEIGKTFRDKYGISKWFADTAMPSHMKSFTKNGMRCQKFDKDVMGGIEALRSKMVSASGKRYFKVIQNESNKKAITAIQKHRFMLDGQGNATLNPDDERGIADICDTLRYIGQNLFPVKGTQKVHSAWVDQRGKQVDPNDPLARKMAEIASQHETQMKEQITKLTGGEASVSGSGKKGGFYFSF